MSNTTPLSISNSATAAFFAPCFVCVLFISFVFTHAAPANAAVYECQAKQAVVWRDGNLGPDKNTLHPVSEMQLEFDTDSQKLWTGFSGNAKSPMLMKIVVPMEDQYDLVAVSVKESDYKGNYEASHVLRIRAWDKKVGLVFTLFGGDTFIAGTCIVSSQ